MNRWIIGILALVAILPLCHASPEEERLIREVMKSYQRGGYGPLVLPRKASSDVVEVSLGASLIDVDLDTVKGLLTSHLFLKYLWMDPELTWDPSDFGGLTSMRVSGSLIWKPDIKLFNSHALKMEVDTDCLAVVSNTGNVMWIPPAVAVTRAHRSEVPEVWSSKLKFGSWTYDAFNVSLKFFGDEEHLDVTDFIQGGREIVSNEGSLNTKRYPCCPEPYQDITFTLELK